MDISIFKNGIPVTMLKGKWINLLLVIQKFLTCEGRFGTMFFYHSWLLMHFIDGNEINFPYFLLCSLIKLASSIQIESKSIDNSLYHHRLIKILINEHLEANEKNWQDFLVWNHFVEIQKEETSRRDKRSCQR